MKYPVGQTRYARALKLNEIEKTSKEIIPVIIDDVQKLESRYNEDRRDMASARAAIRAYFSLVEAFIFFLKEISLILCEEKELKDILLEKEKEELAGKRRDIRRGKLIENRFSNGFLDRVKNVLKYYTKLHDLKYRIDPQSDGWQKFVLATQKRHHLTHPTKISDITISEKEYEYVKKAAKWFLDQQREIDRLRHNKDN